MILDRPTTLYLRWLAHVGKPMWGGHLERSEPLKEPEIKSWLDAGLIELANPPTGYVITQKGRTVIEK